jgi:hypothetical protein
MNDATGSLQLNDTSYQWLTLSVNNFPFTSSVVKRYLLSSPVLRASAVTWEGALKYQRQHGAG